ncbi:hypothetical protein H6G00_28825 [Leptolyngbya sp. FACHB-541]|uniref:hypothetical protein n=1 Tax=Leptolyngbya sp. FACHB-541 TaxID=2692810 RepID=UPI001685D585|nr:hypothetical protein [Leptolyngbya sp. FACHB-541]MBD2000563.1 hypothetical protein [Leptolyngbya sp. FACHB-541]
MVDDLTTRRLVMAAVAGPPADQPERANGFACGGLKTSQVWQGTCGWSKPKESHQVVLFIRKCERGVFEGVIWYPTLGDGLMTVSGKTSPDGSVLFTEDKVLYGELTHTRPGVLAGSKFTAKLSCSTLEGTGEWSDPKTDERVAMEIALKLAE